MYSYADVDLIRGQDSFHAIRPEEYFKSEPDTNTLPVAVRLLIGWVLSGPMATSTGFLSTCFKCNIDVTELARQIKRWYEIELLPDSVKIVGKAFSERSSFKESILKNYRR